jgi:WD40 repeat protein
MRQPAGFGKPGATIMWDAGNNIRLGAIEGFAVTGYAATDPWYDSTGNYAVIAMKEQGTYLWHLPSNRNMLINDFECGLIFPTWDYDQARLYATSPIKLGDNWCSSYIHIGGLRVYDLNTGALLQTYEIGGYNINYEFTDGDRFLVISGLGGGDVPVQIRDGVTGVLLKSVNIGTVAHNASTIELSPDGRFLAVGLRTLRVWDLATLPDDLEQHQPAFKFYSRDHFRFYDVRFIDATTLEGTTRETSRWSLVTGERLP